MKIIIDHDKCNCKKISLCSAVCPYGFILGRNENNQMELLQDYKQFCINCGQCASICPTDAILIADNKETPFKYDKKTAVSETQAEQFLKTRRSSRTFKEQLIPRDYLEKILSITKWIPTASNKQQLKWIVIESPKKVQKLSQLTIDWVIENDISKEIEEQWKKGEDLILRKAPHLIIALGEKDYFWSGAEVGTALAYIELFAHANKLGTCWAGFFTKAANYHSHLKKFLCLPEGYEVFGALMIGYPVYKLHSIPARKDLSIDFR